jgi:hypothetical protein
MTMCHFFLFHRLVQGDGATKHLGPSEASFSRNKVKIVGESLI